MAGCRTAKIDAVKALPARSFNEGRRRGNVVECDPSGIFGSAAGIPHGLVHGVSANAEPGGANALEQTDEVAGGGSEDWLVDRALFVGECRKGRANRSCGCCGRREIRAGEGTGGCGLGSGTRGRRSGRRTRRNRHIQGGWSGRREGAASAAAP
jgi:hypothetical protein